MARGRRRSSSCCSTNMLLLLLLFCAGLLHIAVAKTHIVGGDTGWTLRNITGTFYDEWAAKQKFDEGDELLFVYATGTHNVWEVPVLDVDTCKFSNAVEKYEDANATVLLYRSGDFAFVCEYVNHCAGGMKMKLTAHGTAGSAGPSESPEPEPGAGSPPAPPSDESPEAPETPSETTPQIPSGASSLQSATVVRDLLACLAAALIIL